MTTLRGLCKAALALSFTLLAGTVAYAEANTMGTASTDLWTTDFQKAFMTEKMMHMMDASGKGMVTRDDYNKYMGKMFDMMDKNHKGMLDKQDFLTAEMGTGSTTVWTTDFQKTFRTADMMHMMDKGGKGMVSKTDFMNHMDKIFDMLDKDHNGMLEKSEFIYSQAFHAN
jgi:Ca2+-binding EF-hand superfamily protein